MSFLLAISVGNTRTAVGHFHGEDLHLVQHLANGDVPAIVAAAVAQSNLDDLADPRLGQRGHQVANLAVRVMAGRIEQRSRQFHFE